MVFENNIPQTSPFYEIFHQLHVINPNIKKLNCWHFYLDKEYYNYLQSEKNYSSSGNRYITGPRGLHGPQGMNPMTDVPEASGVRLDFVASQEWIEKNKDKLKLLKYTEEKIITCTSETTYTPKPCLDKIVDLLNEDNEDRVFHCDLKYCDRSELFYDITYQTTETVDDTNRKIYIFLRHIEMTPDKLQTIIHLLS